LLLGWRTGIRRELDHGREIFAMGVIWAIAWLLFMSGTAVVVSSVGSPPQQTPQWIVALNECKAEGRANDMTCWPSKLLPCPSAEKYCRDVVDGRAWRGRVKH
jgi:hypothetical protein